MFHSKFRIPGGGGRGFGGDWGRALPTNRLIGKCCWMGSHFYRWIDYHEGIAFSIELLACGRTFSRFGGVRITQ